MAMGRSRAKSVAIMVRLSVEEKAAFDRAAEVAGISISSWIRERLRAASLRELDAIGEMAPFLTGPVRGKNNG
jgi:hypothetical protein